MTATAANDPVVDVAVMRRWLILASVVLGSTIYNATILVASGLQPQMQGAMSATQDEIAWTVTFNILATAIVTPMTGWLTARFGARNVMIWSVFTFTVATLMCGFATSLESLVFWRIVQGGGGAPLVPLGQTILLNVFPSMQYGLATGLVDGAVRLRHFKPEMKDRPEIKDLLPRIVMEAYEDAVVSADLAKQNPALVQVTMADGSVLETRVQFPSGSSQKPMSEADTDAKFRDCATGVLPAATLDRAAAMLSGFGTLSRAGDLMALFRAESAKAAAAE